MTPMRSYYVYILTNRSGTLYVGVTNDLERRMFEHKRKLVPGFTSRYNIDRLLWFEEFQHIDQAIEGEKKLKGWNRKRKLALIAADNPRHIDLAAHWFRRRLVKDAGFEGAVNVDAVNHVLTEFRLKRHSP